MRGADRCCGVPHDDAPSVPCDELRCGHWEEGPGRFVRGPYVRLRTLFDREAIGRKRPDSVHTRRHQTRLDSGVHSRVFSVISSCCVATVTPPNPWLSCP